MSTLGSPPRLWKLPNNSNKVNRREVTIEMLSPILKVGLSFFRLKFREKMIRMNKKRCKCSVHSVPMVPDPRN